MHSIKYQEQEERLYRREDQINYEDKALRLVDTLIGIIGSEAYVTWCETLPTGIVNYRHLCELLQAEIDKAMPADCGCVTDAQSCPTCRNRAAEVYAERGE